ncbi:Pre-mRNA-processing factor 39 [Fulvia fulva]|uniref:Pre-mRNA-processing factor 39 n=1 Tax=Passalora fulva TaxID=5499 RepID=A0A9Q8LFZ4_PASFU|nr:Pre-mRNA-processing factor 39 [Fulvia fulva]KAK4615815.1 Pre-mRNA-processing factor 39 [Fulvia fulva]KAK4616747.1 Pre-mRNA-processing factor 39 [Fulvia fulva]UJO16677.1 Pre-mRNA-processing factor 39 [Fulvia fulva]WPV19002.1 Pre-mRNA-processing factor 39 [Fulvia fulva]WPV33913.1 Pre-mRNA-processing factor 39 [Fulvia fulva]
MAAQRPLPDIAPEEVIARLRDEIAQDTTLKSKDPTAVEKELRSKISAYHMEIFTRTQNETTKRWTYEQEIKRPYYHVTDLDDAQIVNWRKYLDFEEMEGDYTRTKFLYERCLVTCANYDEFWYRYARWTMGQADKSKVILDEEVRNIYRRASCTYVTITQPEIRLHYARFEESLGKADTAIAIHEAILQHLPSHLETIVSLANTHRRQYGLQPAIDVLKNHISNSSLTPVRGSLIVEQARLIWKVKGNADEARNVFKSSRQPDSKAFWAGWLDFEIAQPTSEKTESATYECIKAVYQDIRKSLLRSKDIRELASRYLAYLDGRGGKEAMAEWTEIDKEINGPISISNTSAATSKATLENGPKAR